MVYTWCAHRWHMDFRVGVHSRSIVIAQTTCNSIYRIAIQQRLLVEFSYDLYCCSNHSPEWHLWYANFSKALSRLSSSGDYKRTRQGSLTVLILYIYYRLLVHAIIILTGPYVHASTSCPITHPPCFYLKATMPYPCALMSYSLISITMYAPCIHYEEPLSLNIIPNSNSF